MIKLNDNGVKGSPNELAKLILLDYLDSMMCTGGSDRFEGIFSYMTELEIAQTMAQLNKKVDSIKKYLGEKKLPVTYLGDITPKGGY